MFARFWQTWDRAGRTNHSSGSLEVVAVDDHFSRKRREIDGTPEYEFHLPGLKFGPPVLRSEPAESAGASG
jgi:hypothetical protein